MKYYKNEYLLVLLFSCLVFLIVLGSKVLDLNNLSFANYFDVLKNYYTYLYYINIQDGNLLGFNGMNYPYSEHILYTDNSPILALFIKLIGLGRYAVGIFNGLILSNYIIAPTVAYIIGKHLNFRWYINLVFSIFVVWMHPQQFNIFSSSNLSLSSVLLLAFLIVTLVYKSNGIKNTSLYLSIVALIFISSFIHLYYLMLTAFVFLPAFFILTFQDWKKAVTCIISTLIGVALVYTTIRITDVNYSLRPEGGLGFNYHLWRGELTYFFKSYYLLDLPFFSKHENYHPDWFSFLGTAFPIIIGLATFYFFKAKSSFLTFTKKNSIIIALFFVAFVASFTAIGNDIMIGSIPVFNFLNPLYLASFVTDVFNNFRFLSRFNFISFIAFSILGFYVLNLLVTKYNTVLAKGIVGLCLITSLIDAYGLMKFQKERLLNSESIFSDENLKEVHVFDKHYDAILPIPFYSVGSETTGFIIDDNNDWTNYNYQLSIKNKTPMIASKLSRTPPSITKKMFSLFQEETDSSLLETLKGKNIIIALSLKYDSPEMNDEPATTISRDKRIFIEKWNPTYLYTIDDIEYYELTF